MRTKDKIYNIFISKRILQTDSIIFQINCVLSRSTKNSGTTYRVTSEWKDLLGKNDTSNIGPMIGRNYRESDITNFAPKRLGRKLRKKTISKTKISSCIMTTNVQKDLKTNQKHRAAKSTTPRESKQIFSYKYYLQSTEEQ